MPQRPAVLSEEDGGGREEGEEGGEKGTAEGKERKREEDGGGRRKRKVFSRQRQEKHCGKRLGGRKAHSWDLTSGTQGFSF